MDYPIRIREGKHIVHLSKEKHYIDILGGWKVDLGKFAMSVINCNTRDIIKIHTLKYGNQTFKFTKKAKRIASLEINSPGDYELNFGNIDTLKVRSNNTIMSSLWEEYKDMNEIALFIYKDKEGRGSPVFSYLFNKYKKYL